MTTSSLRYFSLGNKWWSWKDRVSMQILTASKYRCQRRSLKEAITTAFQKYFSLETGDGPERTEFWTFWNEAMRYIESCHNSSRDASLQFPSATVVTLVNCDKIQRTVTPAKGASRKSNEKSGMFHHRDLVLVQADGSLTATAFWVRPYANERLEDTINAVTRSHWSS